MVMARCEFEQPVVGGDVHVGIADEDIGIADVRRRHSEPQHPMVASGHASFDHAAGGSRKGLVVNDPAIRQSLTVHNEVGRPLQVLDVGELRSVGQRPVRRRAGNDQKPDGDDGSETAHMKRSKEEEAVNVDCGPGSGKYE